MKNAKAKLLYVILASLLIPIIPFVVIGELPGEVWLSRNDHNAALFALTGGALLAGDTLMPVPSSIVGTMLGARLGVSIGWLTAFVGMTLGSAIGYGAGRLLLGRLGTQLSTTPTLIVLFLTRPVPVLAEAMTFTAGAEKTPFLPFIIACAAGNALYAFALALNGAALLGNDMIGPGLILPMALPVLAWGVWRWLRRRPVDGAQGP